MTAEELDALIERVESATGPDRERAADVCEALGFKVRRHPTRYGRRAAAWAYLAPDRRWHACEPILSSIDAALALMERFLPGVFWLASKGRTREAEPLYACQLMFGTDEVLADAEADTIALAIILATIRALRSIRGGKP